MNLDRGPQSPPQKPPENRRSKIMSLPLPKIDADQNGDKAGKKLKQPIVIDKVQAGPMTDDGRDWGERCVDMYKIVDKVRKVILILHHLYICTCSLRSEKEPTVKSTRPLLHLSSTLSLASCWHSRKSDLKMRRKVSQSPLSEKSKS